MNLKVNFLHYSCRTLFGFLKGFNGLYPAGTYAGELMQESCRMNKQDL